MLKFIILIFTGLMLCLFFDIETRSEIRTLHHLIHTSDTTLRKKGFRCFMTGGQWHSTIKEIARGYSINQYCFKTVEDARRFFVPLADEYIRPFNEEPSIRPYLANYPLNSRNFYLIIKFVDMDGNELLNPWIGSIHAGHGKITYYMSAPDKSYTELLYSEPFEEAQKIVYGLDQTTHTRQSP